MPDHVEVKAYSGPTLSLKEAKQLMINCFITEKRNPEIRQIPFLLGPPGIGKSALAGDVHQFLDQMDLRDGGPGWDLLSYRLNQQDPTDLKGIPSAQQTEDGQMICTYAAPGVFPYRGFPKSASGKNVFILLDEIAQAPQTMQALGANISDGRVGDYWIDAERSYIAMISNAKEDGAATFTVPRNIVSRVIWARVMPTIGDWEEWAIKNGVHPTVLAFLIEHPHLLNEKPSTDMTQFCTPRGWEKVSSYMTTMGDDWYDQQAISLAHVYGAVGRSAAQQFFAAANTMKAQLRIEDIERGLNPPVPAEGASMALYVVQRAAHERVKQWHDLSLVGDMHPSEVQENVVVIGKRIGEDKIERFGNIFLWLMRNDPAYIVLLTKHMDRPTSNIVFNLLANHPILKTPWTEYSEIRRNT